MATGDTFYLYTEPGPGIEPDSDGICRYKVEAFLLQTGGKRKGYIILLESEYFSLEEGAEIIKQSLKEETEKTEIKGRIKILSREIQTDNPYSVLAFSIPTTVEDGVYYLLVVTSRHDGKNNSIWRELRIEQKKSMHSEGH